MHRAAFLALLSHWRRQPLQLIALLFGLAAATALWTGVQAINQEARSSYDAAASALGQGTEQRLTGEGPIPRETFIALRRAGWLVSPVVEGQVNGVTLLGVDPFTLPPMAASPNLQGDRLGAFLNNGLILANADTAPALAGYNVETAANIPDAQATMDVTTAWEVLGKTGFDYLVVTSPQPMGLPPLTEVAPGLTQVTEEAAGDIANLTRSFHLNLTAFGLLSFAVGLFIVHAAIGLAFEQRRSMFRTLRALGLPARNLTLLLAGETAVFALLAGALGVVLGYGVASMLLPGVAGTLRGLYGASVPGSLTLDLSWVLSGFAITFAGASVAAASSLWRVATLPILAPARPRAWAMASVRGRLLQAGAGALLLVISAVIIAQGEGLVAGFAMLGALLFGAALMLPFFLDLSLRAAAFVVRGVLGQWVVADTRQQVPGMSLALMALLLALAANIGVGTMVSSFRATFTGWLDQRLASELYLTAQTPAQAAALEALLDAEADATLPLRTAQARLVGAPAAILGVVDHVTYQQGWPLIEAAPDPWARMNAGEGAFINEQLWRRTGLAMGDRLELLPGWSLPIVGVYTDYGNPEGQAMVAQPELLARVPDLSPLRYAARVAPERVEDLRKAAEALGVPAGNILDQASVKRFSLDVFERTFLVTGALNVLTLGVAAIAILASLTTLASMRLPQLAPVWAMGLTRARLARLELLRAALFAALTFLFALPLGLAVAWMLLSVVNVQAFGWKLPMLAFPVEWLRLLALALLAALLAAALPAWRLGRMAPSRLLKVFADER
ncbi:MAG: FtsX-like permease family protein [Rhodobacteraceae bacterium]|nr:FtsX-like permease family protein [Paracoccaceae bacterium]